MQTKFYRGAETASKKLSLKVMTLNNNRGWAVGIEKANHVRKICGRCKSSYFFV